MVGKAKHILILERDGCVAQTVHSMAQVLGHDPCICASTDEALAELSRKHYDVVITNRHLKNPSVSLPWLVRSVQPGAKVIVTACTRGELGPAIPVDGVLQKPFGLSDLEQAIGAAARR